jgi:hypothetical protein
MSNSYKCKEKDFTEMMDNVDAFGFWQTTGISRSGSRGLVLHLVAKEKIIKGQSGFLDELSQIIK